MTIQDTKFYKSKDGKIYQAHKLIIATHSLACNIFAMRLFNEAENGVINQNPLMTLAKAMNPNQVFENPVFEFFCFETGEIIKKSQTPDIQIESEVVRGGWAAVNKT